MYNISLTLISYEKTYQSFALTSLNEKTSGLKGDYYFNVLYLTFLNGFKYHIKDMQST